MEREVQVVGSYLMMKICDYTYEQDVGDDVDAGEHLLVHSRPVRARGQARHPDA